MAHLHFTLNLTVVLRWLVLVAIMFGSIGSALAGKTYSDNGDGTVTDPTTGLIWKRCSEGQVWDEAAAACTGTNTLYPSVNANALTGTVSFAGQSDWRVPNIRELQTIVDRSVVSPTIDKAAFPNTTTSCVWSDTADFSIAGNAWSVNFSYGNADSTSQASTCPVRLVRAGQTALQTALLSVSRPNTDYVDNVNGTITHTPTGLMWQVCAVGQSWNQPTPPTLHSCTGTASGITWDAAQLLTSNLAGHSDWRLPTADELISLVDYSQSNPAINISMFPDKTALPFWSASTFYGDSNYAWDLDFQSGTAYSSSYKLNTYKVRLVRAGQSSTPWNLNISKSGAGTVSSTLGGINCGSVCGGSYTPGAQITLVASPPANLTGWSGNCTGSASTCTVTMDAAKSVTATFMNTPIVSGLPGSLNFAPQNISTTSSAQTVTLSNTGTTTLNIASITASADFLVSHNCGLGIMAGGSCTVGVSFSPTASGGKTGTITITDDAPGSPRTINLTGTGLGAMATLDATSKLFASQYQGTTSSAQTVTLTNTGIEVLNIGSITVSGEFAKTTTTCGASLAQSASCTISVSFTPTTVGALTGSLVITSDAANSPGTVSLSGTGMAAASLSFDKPSLVFGTVVLGSSSSTTQIVRLTNIGSIALNLTGISTGSDFSQTNKCGTGLGAGGFCDVSVTFTPTGSATGIRGGTLTITSNVPLGSPNSVPLSGTASPTVANAPTGISAIAGNAQADVGFTSPVFDGGSPIIRYDVTASPGGATVNGTTSPITFTGLTNGTVYTFTVVAVNGVGNGITSAASGSVTPGATPQTIVFGAAPALVFAGTGTVSATGGASGTPVVFTSTTPLVCTVAVNVVTGVTPGTCVIAANQAANGIYASAAQATLAFTVDKAAQGITIGTAPSFGIGGTGPVSATGGASGNAVTFSSTTPNVCTVTVTGSLVTDLTAGNCVIAANQAGSANYTAAPQVTQTIVVSAISQSIVFGTPPTLTVGGTGTVSAVGGASGNVVTFSSTTPLICTLNGNAVSAIATGNCIIAANQAGNTNYTAATQVTQTVAVGMGAQIITFGTVPTLAVGGTGTVSATSGASGIAIIFGSTTPLICTLSGNTVSAIASGNCIIAANQAGNTNYNSAAQVTQTIVVGKGAQSIIFGAAPALTVGGTGNVSATGGASPNAVTFSSTTPTICTVSGNTITDLTAGNCVITADQAGNADYTAAPQVTQTIVVSSISQSIIFGTAPNLVVGGTGTVSATGGASGNAVTFSSTTPLTCTVTGTIVSTIAAGNCTIAANQAGNTNFTAAPQVTQTMAVGMGAQIITFGTAPSLVMGGTGTVSATGGASGNAVTFFSTTPSVCTLTGNKVLAMTAGDCIIAVNQTGNANYTAAPQTTQTITVGAGSQSITFGAAPVLVVGGTGTVSATGGASGNTITFSSTTPSICTLIGSTVTVTATAVATDTCIIAANQAGNAYYSAATQVPQNIVIAKATQAIVFGSAPGLMVGGTSTISATGGVSGNAVTFSSMTPTVCTVPVSSSIVTGVTSGNCTIAADQASNANYNAALQVTQTIAVGTGTQSIIFAAVPALAVKGTVDVSATGGASPNAVTFSSTTPTICTVSGKTVTDLTAGNCVIAANQAGNANYAAAPQATQTIVVSAVPQTIVFVTEPTLTVGGPADIVSARGGASGNSVTFSTTTPWICTMKDGKVSAVAVGNCVIAANQAGNTSYAAAPQATLTIAVGKGSQSITFGTAPTLTVNGTGIVSATGGASGNAVTFTSTTLSFCTVSGNVVTGVTAGNCTIAANQAGSANFDLAPLKTQDIVVSAISQSIVFGTAPTLTVGGSGTVSATGGASGNAVTFSSTTTPTVCTVSGSTVTDLTAGNCVIAANQAGNNYYAAAPQATQTIVVSAVPQSIVFGTAPTLTVGGTGTVRATGGASGNAVTFSSTTPWICTLKDSTVKDSTVSADAVAVGNCVITANQAGNTSYAAALQATQTIAVGPATQTIKFGSVPSLIVGGTGTISATGDASGNAVTFTSTTSSVCTVSGNVVTGVTAGNCVIAANQAGNANYAAAPQATQTIPVGIGTQSITFGTVPTLVLGGTGAVSATGGASGNPVTFSSTTPNVCTVTGGLVTDLTAGKCVIAANQASNANYAAAPQVTQTITVGAGSQSITFGTVPTLVLGGTGTVSATGGASGNPVTFSSTTPTVCTVTATGGQVTDLTAGNCVIAANQASNANYAAAPQVTQTITVGAGSQSITFVTVPTPVVGGTGTVSATGGASGNLVTFSSITPLLCILNGSTVTAIATGNCIITANQAGNANYTAAPQTTQTITVGPATQPISFGPVPTLLVGGTGTVSATGGLSGHPVTFSSTTPSVCTVSGNVVTGVTVGPCTIAADQAGNANYAAAPKTTQALTVDKGTQIIVFGTKPSLALGGTGTVSATGGASGNAVTFTSTTLPICTVSGNVVTGLTLGDCIIAADQAGNANYAAASQMTQTITVGKATQTIVFGSKPSLTAGGTGTVSATGGASSNPVTFTSTTLSVCTVSGNVVTGVTLGDCIIAADQAGNTNYTAAPQTKQTITVGAGTQTIVFDQKQSLSLLVGGTGTVIATGGNSGNAVTFSSITPLICISNGGTVKAIAAGNCIIAANQAGNASYTAAPQTTQSITVGPATQTISFGTVPFLIVGSTGTVSATGGASGNAVTFTSTTLPVCTVSGNVVTGVTLGDCVIAADQAGNTNYTAAQRTTQTLTVGAGTQTIVFGSKPSLTAGGTGTVSATGGASGKAVTFTSTTSSVCTVSGNVVTGVTAGNCTIAADQVGNTNYAAASPVTQTIAVGAGTQTIVFGLNPGFVVGSTGTISATGGASGNAVTLSSITPLICTLNGSEVKAIATGNCTIAANQAGNINFTAAPQTTQTIVISTGPQTISFGVAPSLAIGGSGTVTATGGASGNPVTFSSATSTICTVSGSTVTGLASGECTIAANQAGNVNYKAAAQVTQSFTVSSSLSVELNLLPGWNLVGNSVNAPFDVTTQLANATQVTTVWKWLPAVSKWAFYSPGLADGGAAYAVTKGYEPLTTIHSGEGYWVNAKSAFKVKLATDTGITTALFQDQADPAQNKLLKGWNLIATGDNPTPSEFNQRLSVTPPTQGTIPLNLTTLWAWNSALGGWYFYAPGLEVSGGLAIYITSKNYLDFSTKTLAPAMGFWVNKP